MEYFKVKNWSTFQHYKDRNPPWIKLYTSLLDDYDFACLSDHGKLTLLLILLVAARTDNKIPNDPAWLKRVMGVNHELHLDPFIHSGFITEWADIDEQKWPSRHVPKQLRLVILERDGHKCLTCGSTQNLEIDHVIPVSKGGKSVKENLQTLCRSCNRRKRVNIKPAEQLATQTETQNPIQRSLETETETETETELKGQSKFDQFWCVYPKKVKKKTARDIWKRKRLDNKADEIVTDIQIRLESDQRWLKGFIPDPTTYLNQERWDDECEMS